MGLNPCKLLEMAYVTGSRFWTPYPPCSSVSALRGTPWSGSPESFTEIPATPERTLSCIVETVPWMEPAGPLAFLGTVSCANAEVVANRRIEATSARPSQAQALCETGVDVSEPF